MLNIKYDIVGSFLRPKEIHDARKKFFKKEISLEELTKIEDGFETVHLDKVINGTNHHIEYGKITGKFSYDPNKKHREVEAYDFLYNEVKKYPGIIAKKSISGPNMILIDHLLQLGIKNTEYYGTDIDALINDIGLAYQAAIKDFYNHGCRYLQIDDTSWTYMIDEII